MASNPIILFPSDFSHVATHAYRFALHLASAINARIVYAHIFHPVPLELNVTPKNISRALEAEDTELAIRLLGQHAKRMALEVGVNVPIEPVLKYGYAIEELTHLANELGPDLLIMGTTGASNAIENWLGSTTTALMERVNCPVMAIPEAATFHPIKHIIYATDLHEGGERFLYTLSNTAHQLGASLERIHVLTHALSEADRINLEDRYGTLLAFADMPLRVVEGKNIPDGLTSYAENHKVDLIALSPQKHSLWHQLWHSSQTCKLLLHSTVPVLAVKS